MFCFIVLCCYVIKILGLEGLVTANAQTITLRTNPKCGLSTLRSNSRILE